jgi:hypothetical protein
MSVNREYFVIKKVAKKILKYKDLTIGRQLMWNVKTEGIPITPSRWCFHLIVVTGFEYTRDPESYTSGSVATGRASLAAQVKG